MQTPPTAVPNDSRIARMIADQKQRAQEYAEDAAVAQRWPMPFELRGHVIGVALELCGLKTTREGTVERTEGKTRPTPREKLAAMRVIAGYDKVSLEERRAELRDNPTGENPVKFRYERPEISEEIGTQALMFMIAAGEAKRNSPPPPPPPPIDPQEQAMSDVVDRVRDARWPISMEIRYALVTLAAELCGLAISVEGKVERIEPTDEAPGEPPRIKLAALRILMRFDRLSIEHRRVERLRKPSTNGPFKRTASPRRWPCNCMISSRINCASKAVG